MYSSNAEPQWGQQNYDGPKNASWNSPQGFRDSKYQNNQAKPQWNNNRQRQQTKYAADGGRAREWAAPRGAPMPAPPAPWQPALANQQGVVAVTLEGLPPALCKQKLLEAILEQAGLTDSVMGCILGEKQDTGKALIHLGSRQAAQTCIDHFGGCCWDRAGKGVVARMVDGPSEQVPQAPGRNVNPRGPNINMESQARNNMGSASPQLPMGRGMIAMPQPTSTHMPPFMVNEPPWRDVAPGRYPMHPQHNMVPFTKVGEFQDASTVADGSSRRSTWDNESQFTSQLSSGSSGNLAPYDEEGYDTDDGF